jgi:predicted Zn-dependent protease
MSLRSLVAIASLGCVSGCTGAVHQLPQASSSEVKLAQTELASTSGAPQRHETSDDEALGMINSALVRIRPSADQVCREMNAGVCTWTFRPVADRNLNAYAGANGVIVINRGVADFADDEEEVAMVIAHEIGHQSANHMAMTQRNQMVGALVGGVLFGALGAVASYRNPNAYAITRTATDAGGQLGAGIGRISYSKEQEREADYLAAVILYRAGLDLDKARGMLVKLGKMSSQKTGLLDSHPAGPERLAAWDRAVAEVRASNGQLPKRTP